jgi:hypothetical protein
MAHPIQQAAVGAMTHDNRTITAGAPRDWEFPTVEVSARRRTWAGGRAGSVRGEGARSSVMFPPPPPPRDRGQPKRHATEKMQACVFGGKDMALSLEEQPRPTVTDPKDVVVAITSTTSAWNGGGPGGLAPARSTLPRAAVASRTPSPCPLQSAAATSTWCTTRCWAWRRVT